MKSLAYFSKALTVGTVASLLLLASVQNQVALGTARATTQPIGPVTVAMSTGFWSNVADGLRAAFHMDIGIGASEPQAQQTLVAMEHYQNTDFSQFDTAPM